MFDVLELQSNIVFDESIAQYDIHAHKPYNTSTFNSGDEIRIAIQQQEVVSYQAKVHFMFLEV